MRNDKKIIVVVEGPSGVGKDSIVKKLIAEQPDLFYKAQSMTNRDMRSDESQGNPYFFVSTNEFEKLINNNDIFEFTIRHGTYRGMSKNIFDDILAKGYIPIKDCDYVGLKALKNIYGKNIVSFFIYAPKNEVIKRLINRGEDKNTLSERIEDFDECIKQKCHYDYIIENIDLDKAVKQIKKIIQEFYDKL